MMTAFLIQGFFFQWKSGLGIAYLAGEGAVPEISRALTQCMFSGAIWTEPGSDEFVGRLDDRYGESRIFNIRITDLEFNFDKKYERRSDVIHYTLRRNGDHWVGEYNGKATGNGLVQCALTSVPDGFFDPREAAKDLGKPEFLESSRD